MIEGWKFGECVIVIMCILNTADLTGTSGRSTNEEKKTGYKVKRTNISKS